MLKLSELSYAQNGKNILNSIDLSIKQGDFLALFGPDDAGKTTLLHILMGFLTKYEGTAEVFGKSADTWGPEERGQVRFVPDRILWEPYMTAGDYFRFVRSASPVFDEKMQKELCSELEIPMEGRLLELTYQENKFVQIIAAVCVQPKLLILDEPANFLGTQGSRMLLDKLQQWNRSGMGIVLAVEQYEHAKGFCKSYAYLKEGSLIAAGKVPQPDVRWKVITVEGKSPVGFQKAMDQCIGEHNGHTSFLYRGDMKKLSDQLKRLGSKDFAVEEMTLEEELEMDFSRWE